MDIRRLHPWRAVELAVIERQLPPALNAQQEDEPVLVLPGDRLGDLAVELLLLQPDGQQEDLLGLGACRQVQRLFGEAVLHHDPVHVGYEFFLECVCQREVTVERLLGQAFPHRRRGWKVHHVRAPP